jgi:hypothetical protein
MLRRRQLVEMLTAEKNRPANSPKVIHKRNRSFIRSADPAQDFS